MADEVWHRLELLTTSPELVAAQLWDRAALGVEVQDRDTYMEDGSIAPVPEGWCRLIAFFDSPFEPSNLPADVQVIANTRFDDRSWETAWMKFFHPVAISRRAIVGPPWETFDAPPGDLRIVIEPGLAFGTGTHETTGLCGELIDELVESSAARSMLDVGCGTGVLAMIAAGLGVPTVAAIDNDPIAVEVATENLRLNGFGGRVRVSTTPLNRLGTYNLVVANILAGTLIALREDLLDRVAPEGHLITSGITVEQSDEFVRDFVGPDLEFVERRQRGEWVAIVWRRFGSA